MLPQKIKQYRKIRNMTQEKLAEEIGISVDQIASIESGRRKVSVENLISFCECFHVNINELLQVDIDLDNEVRKDWVAEINQSLDSLDIVQLRLVRTMICSLVYLPK